MSAMDRVNWAWPQLEALGFRRDDALGGWVRPDSIVAEPVGPELTVYLIGRMGRHPARTPAELGLAVASLLAARAAPVGP